METQPSHCDSAISGRRSDAILITATRAERSPENEPTRVEVIPPREVNEEVTLHPGEVERLLGEASGIRVQITSAAFGGAGVRILGLQGLRYTQFLIDGMPLAGRVINGGVRLAF